MVHELGQRKLCGRYFLTRCTGSGLECPKGLSHDGELSAAQKNALMRFLRMFRCKNGTGCDDVDCVAGHQCPYDGRCDFAEGDRCRFGPDMHGVDRTTVAVS